jgi:hypothetical protein
MGLHYESNYPNAGCRYIMFRSDSPSRRMQAVPQMLPDSSYTRLCSHEFLWPRRAADGHYYQVCLLCGAKYKYDWKSMQRIERVDSELRTKCAPGSSNQGAHLNAAPRLRLLLELEPAHRVFFRNLADLLLFRTVAPVAITSRPAPFWRDVFVCSGVPWRWLLGSTVSQVIVIAAVLILFQGWAQREPLQRRRTFYKSYISYYTPSPSFPALRSSPSRIRAVPKRKPESAHQAVTRVPPERTRKIIRPPDIKRTESAPNVLASTSTPLAIPLSSNKLTLPAVPNSVVASLSDLSYATARRRGLPQGSVVAPPPEVKAVSLRRGIITPNAGVVGPPATVQSSIRNVGNINIGQSAIVEPSPRLPMSEQRAISGMPQATLGSSATSVVPPPTSFQSPGALAGRRVSSLSSSTALQVVPPAPSVRDTGSSARDGRVSSLASTGLQVVPPPPSVQDAGNSAGDGQVRSLSNTGPQVVPPAPSVQDAGNSGTGGRPMAMSIPPVVTSPPRPVIDNSRGPVDNSRGPVTEEMAIRLIGLALALPSSSYFSNYEVFIAERRISKVASQLIKLVYVSLPYQRRLSEYGLSNSRVYKLRVSRDQTCDESLLQMTWPETDPHPGSQSSTDSPGLSPNDRNGMLPCYRTTADDYRRALSRGR